ncbi:MAG: hypothetical protein EBZ69_02535 [Alphaproteobacteria bacterium]|nr:hypothetical protein [Alphaproteobacteria bacterium]NDC95671.1 hypothetical protein [bacterium]NDG19498.1 hypothetical protein [Betaproteobacteria bacterium]
MTKVHEKAIEYLRFAVSQGTPVYFIVGRSDSYITKGQAIRLLSKLKLLEKVPGYIGQHWQATEQGKYVVQNGYELSAIMK